jgi:hypothetical protein
MCLGYAERLPCWFESVLGSAPLRLRRRRAGVPDVVEDFVDDGGVGYICDDP